MLALPLGSVSILMLILLFVISGMRFGLLQVKVGLVFLLSNYMFSVCEKTQLPVKLDPRQIITTSAVSILLRVNKRSNM
jgi:cytochrome P450 family 6